MLWLFSACLSPSTITDSSCDPRVLNLGELRARARECSDEAIPNGESRRGELLLENARIRVGVRAAPNALTQFHTAGGGIVDIATPTGSDLLNELIPLVNGEPIKRAQIQLITSPIKTSILLEGRDGEDQAVQAAYHILPDIPRIDFEGNDDLLLIPDQGFQVFGNMLIDPQNETALIFDGQISDLGGHIIFENSHSIAVDTPDQVWKWLDPNAYWYTVSTNSEWLQFFSDSGNIVGAFPVTNGQFSGYIPSTATQVQGVRKGCTQGNMVSIDAQNIPEPETCTSFMIRTQDDDGQPVFARLTHDDGYLIIPPSGLMLPTAEPLSSVVVSAGSMFDVVTYNQLTPPQSGQLDITLRRTAPSYLNFSPIASCAPDRENRKTAEEQAQLTASNGIDVAICSAQQLVPEFPVLSPHTESATTLWPGSFNASPLVLAWPWEQTLRDAGYGAIPPDLNSKDMLDYAAKTGRNTMVDTAWVDENPPPWDTPPDFLLLQTLDDVSLYLELLTNRVPIRPLSPMTTCLNLDKSNHHPVDIERELWRMHTALGNGPIIELGIDGAQNGDIVPTSRFAEVSISVHAPRWMSLETLNLWSDNILIQSWDIEGPIELKHPIRGSHNAIVATVSGRSLQTDEAIWGMSSPILFSENVVLTEDDTGE